MVHGNRMQPDLRQLSDAARSLWAKSGDDLSREGGREPWLALPQHMLDSAGVAELIWGSWAPRSVREHIMRRSGLEEQEALTLLRWLACVHDIGKATLSFASQIDDRSGFEGFMDRIRNAGLPAQMPVSEQNIPRFHHSLASRVIVKDWLRSRGVKISVARGLVSILDAHHGVPSERSLRPAAETILSEYDPAWREVHEQLLTFAAELTGIHEILPRLQRRIDASGQTLLTGLVIMADWIASNAEAFPLTEGGIAGERSERGYHSVDLTSPWVPAPPASVERHLDEYLRFRFGWPAHFSARPVQREVADTCAAVAGAGLVIIEAPTGEGKTEAALTAAEILAVRSGAGGVMVAAPTMATADGLFRRVLDWSRRAGNRDVTSMFLGHSKSMLNADYRQLKYHDVNIDDAASAEEGVVIASQWMSGRKKGVFSNFTVATVDQVLFMALQAKHSMLRHLGLAGKVIIIDEAHAYDTYMSEYLARALEWLARYHVPVIVLSATLPTAQKRGLIEAYRSQLLAGETPALSTHYPLVTTVSAEGVTETPVSQRQADLQADLSIVDDSWEALGETLSAHTPDGGCVLVICNTVQRAQAAYVHLCQLFEGDVDLHHAAFLASSRAQKEELLRSRLGPEAHREGDRPYRRFIVATQVAEQSLDIDVDLLVTDIAPMDLLIQRIGRLHRHARPEEDRPENLRNARVLIRGVVLADPPEFESGTAAVYDPKLLLATLAVLNEGPLHRGFTRPDDIAPLVHRTYGEVPPIPEAWKSRWVDAVAQSEAARASARLRANTYRFPSPQRAGSLDDLFCIQGPDIDSLKGEVKGLAQVRDSDPTIEVIPILSTPHGYRLISGHSSDDLYMDAVPTSSTALDLASSTVRLPARFSRYEHVFEEVLDQLEPATPPGWHQSPYLKGQIALPLDEQRSIELAGRILIYDDELGLYDDTPSSPQEPASTPNIPDGGTLQPQGES